MNLRIRRATIKDLPKVQSLSQELFEHERQFTDEFNMEWSNSVHGKRYFEKALRSRTSFAFLAEIDDMTVGYILIRFEHHAWRAYLPIAEVVNFSVHPMHRGQGIGSRLFEEAKKLAKKRGAKRMSVEAIAANTGAVRFYKTRGFSEFDIVLLARLD